MEAAGCIRWTGETVKEFRLVELCEHFGLYRLVSERAEQEMRRSLREHGQLSDLIACRYAGRVELIDGFKRVAAARSEKLEVMSMRFVKVDARSAKVAMYRLNSVGGRFNELEEAWLVRGLGREDGLSQAEVGELLGRHKSWVSRRLALLEKLATPLQDALRVGVLSVGKARELTKLPAGNQADVLDVINRESLSRDEVAAMVRLLDGPMKANARAFVLGYPREAIARSNNDAPATPDPRLSRGGQELSRKLNLLESVLSQVEGVLGGRARQGVTPGDLHVLETVLKRVADGLWRLNETLMDDLMELPATDG